MKSLREEGGHEGERTRGDNDAEERPPAARLAGREPLFGRVTYHRLWSAPNCRAAGPPRTAGSARVDF
jgi:hypothetical protein